jgi:hypothetical protein
MIDGRRQPTELWQTAREAQELERIKPTKRYTGQEERQVVDRSSHISISGRYNSASFNDLTAPLSQSWELSTQLELEINN